MQCYQIGGSYLISQTHIQVTHELTATYSGMGGNTALCDTATALPLLVRLSTMASSNGSVDPRDVRQACKEYEGEMIPRAFEWVQKSGGGNMVVSVCERKT